MKVSGWGLKLMHEWDEEAGGREPYDPADAWSEGRHTLALDDTLAWVRETGRQVKRAQIRARIEERLA